MAGLLVPRALLRLVRPWPPEPLCDADQVFELLLPVLGARTRIRRVDYEHRPGGGAVAMRPGDLALAILNLVDNAIDASPEGGRVVTACDMGREAVTIRVEDVGPGVPEELRGAPGASPRPPRPGRSGLGLAVTARLVRRAGGTLELTAGPDERGTAAIITVPRPGSA